MSTGWSITFIIGSGIAGVAGVLDGIKNSNISPFMGMGAAVKGLIVMLLGGLGNVPGAMVAGLMLGMIEILSAAYTNIGVPPALPGRQQKFDISGGRRAIAATRERPSIRRESYRWMA
jgi:branched-subunit amino acid ABC-type transport system permease component